MNRTEARATLATIAHRAEESGDYEQAAATELRRHGLSPDRAEAVAALLAWLPYPDRHEEVESFVMNPELASVQSLLDAVDYSDVRAEIAEALRSAFGW